MTALGGRLVRVPAHSPSDTDAEEAVLGAVLIAGGGRFVSDLASEGLLPEHFATAEHAELYRAMLALEREGEGVDELTLHAWLDRNGKTSAAGGKARIARLAGVVPDLGNVRAYAQRVRRLAEWRHFERACVLGLESVASLDEERRETVRQMVHEADGAAVSTLSTPERLADRMFDWLCDRDTGKVIQTPFARLNDMLLGGLRPGGTTVIAGWTSMGKSVIADQLLEHARHQGFSACAYINEMSEEERVARTLAARTGVPFAKILGRDMTATQWKRVMDSLPGLPFAIQPCAGWTAADIARHVRAHRWGIFLVDLATLIPASTTAEWADVSKTLTLAARQADAHGLIVVQLNHQRDTAGERPPPALRDLKWGGHWADDAANVVFVHRDDVEVAPGIFEPGSDGHLRAAKVRNGRPGLLPVSLDPIRLRFGDDVFAIREEWAA